MSKEVLLLKNEAQMYYGELSEGKLPDLRGKFLRMNNNGASGEKFEPKGDSRKIGSYQGDELKAHSHKYRHMNKHTRRPQSGRGSVDQFGNDTTEPTGGVETRPKNISINYYIKIND